MNKHFTIMRRGIFYFQRRVPKRLQDHYGSAFILTTLRTRDEKTAKKLARDLAAQLDAHWLQLSFQAQYLQGLAPPLRARPLAFDDRPSMTTPAPSAAQSSRAAPTPTLSEVKAIYLNAVGQARSRAFFLSVERAFDGLLGLVGDLPLGELTRSDANALRDALLAKGMSPQTVKRTLVPLRAAFAVAIAELDLNCKNVFKNVRMGPAQTVHARQPFPTETLAHVQRLCQAAPEDKTLLLALISDTGMRLAEAAGLLLSDIRLDAPVPHVKLVKHPWRPLKTEGSAREVPLVGCALWAAQQVVQRQRGLGEDFAFPSFCSPRGCNTHNASARLNFWLRKHVQGEGLVVHSFRHSLRDRLRALECPADMVDQIGGWTTLGVGTRYGQGYPLQNLRDWMQRMVLV